MSLALVSAALGGLPGFVSLAADRIALPSVDFFTIAPELVLFGAALLIVVLRSFVRRGPLLRPSLAIAVAGIVVASAFAWWQWKIIDADGPYQSLAGMVAMDGFAVFVKVVVLVATLFAVMIAAGFLAREELEGPEYLALMLLSSCGMLAMASANDLIAVFVALEVLSIALYVLAAFARNREESREAGFKYFILGAFSSAVFLYGVALVYGATGSTSLTKIAQFLSETNLTENGLLLAGFALLLVGLGFKVAAAPFHMWTPDVYEGSPTPVTAFMASATKIAAFAALARIFVGSFGLFRSDWRPVLFVLAVLSMVVGTTAAVMQTNVKRMLAYSSISHAGYALIGIQAATDRGLQAVLFYLFVYSLMALGSFAVVMVVARRGDAAYSLDEYRNLALRDPRLAGVFTFLLLAQAGVPLTGGFVAKLAVFRSAVDAGQYWLALVGMLCAVIGAFVYLRIVVTMWTGSDSDADEHHEAAEVARYRFPVDGATGVVITLCVVGLLVIGIYPATLLDFARYATLLI